MATAPKQALAKRYAAKLLFAYRVEHDDSRKRRKCRESIFLISASSAHAALKKAKRLGQREQSEYDNDEGNLVSYEFLGVRELLCLDLICERNEVWYDPFEYRITKKSIGRLIPDESRLEAIRNE